MNKEKYRELEAKIEAEGPDPSDNAALLEYIKHLEQRIRDIERPKSLGPHIETKEEKAAQDKIVEDFIKDAKAKFSVVHNDVPPVDRNARVLVSGAPVPEDYGHTEINPATGMQKEYIVLTSEERSKGYVRPVRRAYKHLKCGAITTMALSIAQTMARDPGFYSGGYCATCKTHFGNEEFSWPEDGTQVGS